MDAEIQFFMTETDQKQFLDFAQSVVDKISMEQDSTTIHLAVGDVALFFTPSSMEGDTLYTGKLEIRLGRSDLPMKTIEPAKKAFRKLRNWIKKHYFSRLAYRDKNKKNKLTPTRVHWLGMDAKKWKEANPEEHHLKLSPTSWMEFDIGF